MANNAPSIKQEKGDRLLDFLLGRVPSTAQATSPAVKPKRRATTQATPLAPRVVKTEPGTEEAEAKAKAKKAKQLLRKLEQFRSANMAPTLPPQNQASGTEEGYTQEPEPPRNLNVNIVGLPSFTELARPLPPPSPQHRYPYQPPRTPNIRMSTSGGPYYASENRTANMSPPSPARENNSYSVEFDNTPPNGDNMADHTHVLGGHHYPTNGYMQQGGGPYQGHMDEDLAQSAMAAGIGHSGYPPMAPHGGMNDRRSSGSLPNILEPQMAGKGEGPPKKATRACDNCRRKKVKCEGGDPGNDQPCVPCSKEPGQRCQYERTPQKRGPNKGYIQDLKDDLDVMKKTREEQLADIKDDYEKMKRLVINLEADLDYTIRRLERAEKLLGRSGDLPDLPDEDPARKRARRNHMSDPNDLLLMGIDEQMAIAKYRSSYQPWFPLLPLQDKDMSLVEANSPAECRSVFFAALNATVDDVSPLQATQKAASVIDQAPTGSLMHLQAQMLLLIAIQRAGSHDIVELPSTTEVLNKAIDEYKKLSLKVVNPNIQAMAFMDTASHLAYNRVVRATSLTLRSLILFHSLGTGERFDEMLVDIDSPGNKDHKFLPQETITFEHLLEPIADFLMNPHSATIELSLGRARRHLDPEHLLLVDVMELAFRRINKSGSSDFPRDALNRAQAMVSKAYKDDADGRTRPASTHYYFHALAMAVKTFMDLQKEDVDSVLKDIAWQALQDLGEEVAAIPKKLKSGWDVAVGKCTAYPRDHELFEGDVDWTKGIADGEDGYLSVLSF